MPIEKSFDYLIISLNEESSLELANHHMLSMMCKGFQPSSDKSLFIVSSRSDLRYFDRNSDRRLSRPTQRQLSFKYLEDRRLKAAGDLRVVSYNIRSFSGVPSSELGTVLQAIGSESVGGLARPIDLLAIQESRTQATAAPLFRTYQTGPPF